MTASVRGAGSLRRSLAWLDEKSAQIGHLDIQLTGWRYGALAALAPRLDRRHRGRLEAELIALAEQQQRLQARLMLVTPLLASS